MKAFFRIALSVLLMLSLVTPAFSAIEGKDKTYSGGRTYALTEEIVRLTGLDVFAPAHALESMGLTKSNEEGLVKIGTYDEVFGIQPQFQKYSDENCFYARILNTETLEVSCVSFEEGTIGMKSAFANVQSADYPVGIRFIANDLIIINTDDGIRLFRIR